MNIFKKLQLAGDRAKTVLTLASGGDFTKDYSHEFQTICETGEDTIFYSEEKDVYFNKEVTPSLAPKSEFAKEKKKKMEVIKTPGMETVEALVEHFKIPIARTVKTIVFETDEGEAVAVGLRGNYDINEEKLIKILGCKSLKMASAETIKKVTSAEVGYAGIVDLPKDVRLIVDDSVESMVNFECGANKTAHHNFNVNWGDDVKKPKKFYDIKVAQEGDTDPETGKPYKSFKTSEVGNIFPLGTKFSDAIGYTYTDEKDAQKPVFMGSYGIGSSRIMGVMVEIFNDENGIIWPMCVAPYHVHIVDLRKSEEANTLHDKLVGAGVEVLWDDREKTSAGEKFADADLIGNPIRLVISEKSLDQGGVEFKRRSEEKSAIVKMDDVVTKVQNIIKKEA